MIMNAVGIDVSKRKNTAAILCSDNEVWAQPFDVSHLSANIQSLTTLIEPIDGESHITMEWTGGYYNPVAWKLYNGLSISDKISHNLSLGPQH